MPPKGPFYSGPRPQPRIKHFNLAEHLADENKLLREATAGLLRVIDGAVSESDAATDIAFARAALNEEQR